MNNESKKDALTDLVSDVTSKPTPQAPNNGTVSTPSGSKVELGFQLQNLARKLIAIVSKRKKREKEVREYLVSKDSKQKYERSKTN
jgi:hypothetical protein